MVRSPCTLALAGKANDRTCAGQHKKLPLNAGVYLTGPYTAVGPRGQSAQNLGGSFDNDAENSIFKATFGDSLGTLRFGNVAQAGQREQSVQADLNCRDGGLFH